VFVGKVEVFQFIDDAPSEPVLRAPLASPGKWHLVGVLLVGVEMRHRKVRVKPVVAKLKLAIKEDIIREPDRGRNNCVAYVKMPVGDCHRACISVLVDVFELEFTPELNPLLFGRPGTRRPPLPDPFPPFLFFLLYENPQKGQPIRYGFLLSQE